MSAISSPSSVKFHYVSVRIYKKDLKGGTSEGIVLPHPFTFTEGTHEKHGDYIQVKGRFRKDSYETRLRNLRAVRYVGRSLLKEGAAPIFSTSREEYKGI